MNLNMDDINPPQEVVNLPIKKVNIEYEITPLQSIGYILHQISVHDWGIPKSAEHVKMHVERYLRDHGSRGIEECVVSPYKYEFWN